MRGTRTIFGHLDDDRGNAAISNSLKIIIRFLALFELRQRHACPRRDVVRRMEVGGLASRRPAVRCGPYRTAIPSDTGAVLVPIY